MAYEPLHHKYRPQTFAQLVGQEAIATTLSNALEQRRIAPAYLFSGPRGTGKTSSARILAKSLNCLSAGKPTPHPCGECEVCRAIANGSALDVIEIDAASNTGVDNIRELIERSQFAPVQCRYKVYVIDECHMLSVAAFNALLKTLEEPPAHVVFVLATTDPQRVLPTIISRCQRFDYRRIPLEAMVAHLRKIAHLENIDIPLESVTLVAQIANGGLRDAESLLDQLSLLSGEITPDKVWDLVGAVPERDLLQLIQVIRSDDPEAVIQQCRSLLNRGREPLVVLQNLASFYLNLLIAKTAPQRGDLIAVTQPTWEALCLEAQAWDATNILRGQQRLKESEYQLKNTTQPRLWLEITLLGLLPAALAPTPSAPTTALPANIQVKSNSNGSTGSDPAPVPSHLPNTEIPHPFGETPTVDPPKETVAPEPPASAPTPVIPQVPPEAQRPGEIKEIAPEPVQTPPVVPAPPQVVNPTNGDRPQPPTAEPPALSRPTTSPTISALEREELWQRIIRNLNTLSQALFREHGKLLQYNDSSALVGIKSPNLLGVAKSRTPQLEEAFEKICGHSVKVTVQMGLEAEDNDWAMAPAPMKPPTAAPPAPKVPPVADPVEIAPDPKSSEVSQPALPPVPPVSPPSPQPEGIPSPAPEMLPSVAPEPALVPVETEPAATEIKAIAQQFAEFFAGEVIEITHLGPQEEGETPAVILPSTPDPAPPQASPPIVQGRPPIPPTPDDEVPF
ncbi:MAG: DNA polymerase III subunit gamma/tau [Synechococcus sp.]|nr:DNA polymerase III subunit gamma/tau [Synechococcus sp.]